MRERGLFITFEGIDGAGKTTQVNRLASALQAAGVDVVCTREPGGTKLGDEIRALLLSRDNQGMTPRTEALLYAASRAQHVEEVILPSLQAGKVVLCDRFVDASIAYQGGGLGLGEQAVAGLNEFAVHGVMPDLTIMFELPLEDARTRLCQSRGRGQLDRIEARDAAYFSRVQAVFAKLAQAAQERIHMVDARLPVDALEQEIYHIVWKYIKTPKNLER
ncbi:dTMP kinase [Alicyclobacillus fastidiosus]|uniref:Thymidylate kinase n=1 Tax=Alicyclobacillus fastidiosus TaxID=392011 RepID=A0ABY6ZH45_9BACL|nr:dTMP kinase [Alicyclobacillus fastidiosus]WAH42182.1 dTMP kinase [Alicyclobacillus fastidiosus]GMA63973.1 thymidylate kinase [Alicyclobacillus fastidiosus]